MRLLLVLVELAHMQVGLLRLVSRSPHSLPGTSKLPWGCFPCGDGRNTEDGGKMWGLLGPRLGTGTLQLLPCSFVQSEIWRLLDDYFKRLGKCWLFLVMKLDSIKHLFRTEDTCLKNGKILELCASCFKRPSVYSALFLNLIFH